MVVMCSPNGGKDLLMVYVLLEYYIGVAINNRLYCLWCSGPLIDILYPAYAKTSAL